MSEFGQIELLTLVHSGLSKGLSELVGLLGKTLSEQGVEEHIYGPVLSSLIGPMALGVVVFQP